ncbi:MAG: hypothetical protein JXN61_14460 [Sedimentisphaerales bacterium]|nr:hypothetical protein [Sedimentisphaerales bacterium]
MMAKINVRATLLAILLVLISLLFLYIRIPRSAPASSQAVGTVFAVSSFIFLISAPCFYFVFKMLLGEFIGLLFLVFYVILSVFPYKIFYGSAINLNSMFFSPVPRTVLGIGGGWIVIFYFVIALSAVCGYWFYKTGKFFPSIQKRKAIIFCVLLLAALIQICPRLGKNAPKSMQANIRKADTAKFGPTSKFFGFDTGGFDLWQHIGPSGMFKGDFRKCDGLINRRGLGPYCYSLVSTYFHPYYAAIIVNGTFYFLIIVSGYLLAKHLGLSEAVSILCAILLAANYHILFFTAVPYFYITYFAFIILILLLLFKMRLFEDPTKVGDQLFFCSVLACSGLTYDPYVFTGILFLWGLFHVFRKPNTQPRRFLRITAHTLILAAIPILGQKAWEMLLQMHNLQGRDVNIQSRSDVFSRLVQIPGQIYTHFWAYGALVSRNIIRIVVENPVLPARDLLKDSAPEVSALFENSIEYWSLLGLLGVFSFFVWLPRYIDKEHRGGLYACYISNLSISLISSLVAAIPPLMTYGWMFLSPSRTNNAYPVLILAQGIGIYHITRFCCCKAGISRQTEVAVIVVGVCIYLLSFVRLCFGVPG